MKAAQVNESLDGLLPLTLWVGGRKHVEIHSASGVILAHIPIEYCALEPEEYKAVAQGIVTRANAHDALVDALDKLLNMPSRTDKSVEASRARISAKRKAHALLAQIKAQTPAT